MRPGNSAMQAGLRWGPRTDLVEHLGEVQILYLDLPGASEKFLVKVDGEFLGAHADLAFQRAPPGYPDLRFLPERSFLTP